MYRMLKAFISDQQGNVAVFSALFLVMILGFAALGVDVGKMFADRRKAQGTTDLAALAAVSDLPSATKAAGATIQRNGYPSTTSFAVQLGTYTADPKLPALSAFGWIKRQRRARDDADHNAPILWAGRERRRAFPD